MQDYDIILKKLLRESAAVAVRNLAGVEIVRWLDIELPQPRNPRADLVGETADGTLVHIELQSTNDHEMAVRMFDYGAGIFFNYRRFAHQIVVYVGEAPMRMPQSIAGPDFTYKYTLIDIRDLDAEQLIASANFGDNVIAVLTRLRDQREAIREIIQKLAGLDATAKVAAISHLTILAGLRHLEEEVEKGAKAMPVTIDLMANKVLGPKIRKIEEDAEARGAAQGEVRGELNVIRRQLVKRFGLLPSWVEEKLLGCAISELDALSERLLDAESLDQLFQ